MTTQHTPGPWVAKGRYIGVANHMSYIAECRDHNGNWTNAPMAVANARLIAAAPDLLEALEYVLTAHGEQLHDAFDMARKAIAKAKGE